ncbi:MAG: hypothetical protein V3T05_01510, partial [Myxococcota bacterium]
MPDDLIPRQLPDAVRALDAVDAYQRETDEELEQESFRHFAKLATSLARIRASAWTVNQIKQLRQMLDRALDQAAAKAEQVAGDNPYAIQQAIDNVR